MRYLSVRREIEGPLPTVAELLRKKNEAESLRILSQSDIEIVETGYDNWNGGTQLWTVYLHVPVGVFVAVGNNRDEVAGIITKHLALMIGKDSGYWVTAEISPKRASPPGAKLP